jgi:hypothetical protein
MADDGDKKVDPRFEYLKDRISSAFQKLAGPKLDKALSADDVREKFALFCDDDHNRCLVVPESMKIDNTIPS